MMDEIDQALAKIDEFLPSTGRDMIPSDEIQNLLLDLRADLVAADRALSAPVLTNG